MVSALLTVREAATRLGVSEAAARRWVHRGRLRAARIGRSVRIDPQELDAIVDRGSLDVGNPAATTSSSPSGTPLPWTIREARRYLDALDGDVAIAHAAVNAVALAERPGGKADQ
jgi:excisionase family DNA binding protein